MAINASRRSVLHALLIVLCNITLANAQEDSLFFELKSTSESDGLTIIQAFAKNNSVTSQHLSYKLRVISSGISGSSSNTQADSITLKANEENVLSIFKIKMTHDQVITAKLFVIEDTKETMVDSLTIKQAYSPDSIISEENNTTNSNAQDSASVKQPPKKISIDEFEEGLEINGLIIDETRSKAGRDFYDLFYRKWQDLEIIEMYSIILREDPTLGRIARLSIEVNGDVVYQPVLQPRQEILEIVSDQAITVVQQYFMQQRQINLELESQDQSGTGIY